MFLPLGLFYPFRRFKGLHLTHHNDERLTDPYDDPESYYRSAMDWERIPAGSSGCWRSRRLCSAASSSARR